MYNVKRDAQKETAMKVSREQVALNRERIVETAARLFREKGYDGIGVSDLMKSAGLTHGGFYGHFGSKEDLIAEACAASFDKSLEKWSKLAEQFPDNGFSAIVESYLMERHRDNRGDGCAMSGLAADVAR